MRARAAALVTVVELGELSPGKWESGMAWHGMDGGDEAIERGLASSRARRIIMGMVFRGREVSMAWWWWSRPSVCVLRIDEGTHSPAAC